MTSSRFRFTLVLGVTLGSTALLAAEGPTPLVTRKPDQLISVLQSAASQKEKADACRELSIVGGSSALPALLPLLADEQLSHMARYALETMPDPAVDDALRECLGTLKGRPLVGVIGSIGVRRDARAVDGLAKRLRDSDPDVAQAAARALGKIGNVAAAQAIRDALPATPSANQLAFFEGLFRCAETLAAQNQREEALAIYDAMRGMETPHQVRAGAWRGAILTRGSAGLPLLQQALRSPDFTLVAVAARTAMEMAGGEVTPTLLGELDTPSADKQILLIQTLGKRADAAALPALTSRTKTGDKNLRLAAIRALPELGTPSAAPTLIELLGDAERELAQAAQEGLAALPGPAVDAMIMANLKSGDTTRRLQAMDLIERRRMTNALPVLLKAAKESDPRIRPAALRKVGELAGPSELPDVLDLFLSTQDGRDLEAAERAVETICAKAEKPETLISQLTSVMPKASPTQQGALLRILSAIGGAEALKAVRAAVSDPNPDVHAAGIRALGEWKTADAAPDLLALAKNAPNPTDQKLALRSYLGMAANADLPADQRLAMCREASSLTQSADDKKRLLSALGGIPSADALALATPHLDDSALKEEASAACVTIAERLLKGKNAARVAPKVIEPLEKAARATSDAELAKRIATALQQARGKGAGR